MRPTNDAMVRFLLPTVAGFGCTLFALGAMNAVAAMMHKAPRIGDIVSFTPSADRPVEPGTRLIVHRPDQFGCVLDLRVLRHSGGSLVVEGQATDAAGSFRVHWAGARTSADTANCGNNADLILERQELDILALGAGGYGAGEKPLPGSINRSGV
jgi:hypothetical protein